MSTQQYPRIIEPSRPFVRRRYPVRETETTTVWNDGAYTKTNRFGETEHRRTLPVNMEDPMMQAFFEALDGLAPRPAPALQLVDLDSGEISL